MSIIIHIVMMLCHTVRCYEVMSSILEDTMICHPYWKMLCILEDAMSNSTGGDVFFFWSHVSHRYGNRFVLVTMQLMVVMSSNAQAPNKVF